MMRYDKFNFVFFLNPACDYCRFMFYDAFALSNVRFIELGLADADSRTSLAFRPYRPANNPAAFIRGFDVNEPQAFAKDFPTDDPIVFFFWVNEYKMFRDYDFFYFLRKNYPDCKMVCWLTNPIQYYKQDGMFVDKAGTDEILSAFDCVLTYNQVDAMDYGMNHFDMPYSVLPFAQSEQNVDIFLSVARRTGWKKFCGRMKLSRRAVLSANFLSAICPCRPRLKLTVCTSTSRCLTLKSWSTSCVCERSWTSRNAELTD